MKFHVNDDCIGCGLCHECCEEVFKMSDEGLAVASDEDVLGDIKEKALEAYENCPVSAIEQSDGRV